MGSGEFNDRESVLQYLWRQRNWTRWEASPHLGTLNLVSKKKRVEAAALIRTGESISLSRPITSVASDRNPAPLERRERVLRPVEDMQCVVDYVGLKYHGYSVTHIDALCHVWDERGMWLGADPEANMTASDNERTAQVCDWDVGLFTRGVLLDIPSLRGVPSVDLESPVTASDLEAACANEKVAIGPGDAVVIHMGRGAWEAAHREWSGYKDPRPGLDASCLKFFRERDVSAVIWDFSEARPNRYGMYWTVHLAIPYFGLMLIDNAETGRLAEVSRVSGTYEFLLAAIPLLVVGGTGSPANPVAVF